MAATTAPTREVPTGPSQGKLAQSTTATNDQAPESRARNAKREMPARAPRLATDDEILGIDFAPKIRDLDPQLSFDLGSPSENEEGNGGQEGTTADATTDNLTGEPENLRAAFDANPELRRAWQDAQSYRETFATPEEARAATAVLADVDRMDALFYSRRPEDHAKLARMVASLDPAAFASLAQAMNGLASASVGARYTVPGADAWQSAADAARVPEAAVANGEGKNGTPTDVSALANGSNQAKDDRRARHAVPLQDENAAVSGAPTRAQTDFFQATNAAAVQSVLDAIETQVERLLPDGVSKSARNRVVGEIYRELDTTLRSNRQLAQQMREAFRSGALDAEHQRALVSLVTGRARQALPAVAKRVLNEWTSTIVAANQDRRSRQRAAERRVDIAGSRGGGSEGQRSIAPRDINYARMSDADILNL